MEDIRNAIDGGYFQDFKAQKLEEWGVEPSK